MKKSLLLFAIIVLGFSAFAQNDAPPYKRTLTIPSFTLRTATDSSVFDNKNLDKNKRTIFIYFGPDCGHCTFFTKKLIDSMDLFKNTQIIMVSSFEYSHIKKFYNDYNLVSCPFITVGQDSNYFFISHYGVRQFPSAYVYNKKGKFVKAFESEIEIKELSEAK